MLSRPKKLTTHLLAVVGMLALAAQAPAQTVVLTTPQNGNRIDYTAAPNSGPKEFPTAILATINGAPANVSLTAVISSFNTPWLTITPNTPAPTATPGTYEVGIRFDPTGLTPGVVYNGQVTVSVANGGSQVLIPVSLTVTQPTNSLVVSPASSTFNYQAGGLVPGAQIINILPNGAAAPFTIATSVASSNNSACGNFLSASTTSAGGTSGTTSATAQTPISVALNPTVLQTIPIGAVITCSGSVTISSASLNSGQPIVVPVTLNVANSPTVAYSAQSLTFNFTPNSTAPQSQTVLLSNGGTPLAYSAAVVAQPGNAPAGTTVLSVTPTAAGNQTPGSVTITANPAGLPAGTYTGTVRVTVTGAFNSTQDIPVTINVSSTAQVTSSVSQVNLAYQVGSTVFPAPQTVNLASSFSGVASGFSVAVTGAQVNGQPIVSVTPATGTTPGTLTITPNNTAIQNLAPGTYTASIQVTASNQTSPFATLSIPVVLTVSQNAQLTVSTSAINVNYQTFTTPPAAQILTIGTTGTSLSYSIAVTQPTNSPSGTTIINVAPLAGTVAANAPAQVQVTINPQLLTDGVYTGFITITSPQAANSPLIVPITVTVSTSATLTIGPGPFPLVFRQVAGGSAPAAQNITLSSTGVPLAFSVSTSVLNTAGCTGFQLSASPNTGFASAGTGSPVSISVSGTSAIPANTTCTGSVIITSNVPGSSVTSTQIVPIQFTTTTGSTLTLSSTNLNFSSTLGSSAAPASQQVQITAAGNAAIPVTASASVTTPTGGNWLQLSLSNNSTTPATLTVSVNPAGLPAGTYTGVITVASAGASNSPQTINVTLTVTTAVAGTISGISNAASYVTGTISPGEIVSIFGANLGPTSPVGLTLNTSGNVTTTNGGVTVTFDGIPAPITYASDRQINVVVPYEIVGRASTVVQVSYNGLVSNTLNFIVVSAAPGLFTATSSGSGPLAALNQDSSGNTATNPAQRGSVIVLYGTGEGQTNPGGVTGRVTGTTANPVLPRPVLPVLVRIGGIISSVDYAGEAPGLVSGVMQINARIPAGVVPNADGSVPVEVNIGGTAQGNQFVGGTTSQGSTFIYVK